MKTFHHMVQDLCQAYPEGEARALARWLCEEVYGIDQTGLLLDKDNDLSADDLAKSQEIIERLLRREPIQYILGHTTFCGHRFLTAPGALIPRPETEQLVHHILTSLPAPPAVSLPVVAATSSAAVVSSPSPVSSGCLVTAGFAGSVLDIGTGTGCIALSLALALPAARVTGWDVSPAALSVARANAECHPAARVVLEQADIFQPPVDDRRWNIIVSNPPYVRQSEAAAMEPNVLDHEPHLALFVPDNDPLRFYRAIARYAAAHLSPGGQLWLEINQYLAAETARLIEDFGFADVSVGDDSFGRPRFLFSRLPFSRKIC